MEGLLSQVAQCIVTFGVWVGAGAARPAGEAGRGEGTLSYTGDKAKAIKHI